MGSDTRVEVSTTNNKIDSKEEESSSNNNPPIHLGFIETITDEDQLLRMGHRSANFDHWDGGQVGGCPSFLNPQYVPEALTCQACQEQSMKFLCQIYAPVDEYEDRAFHRSLYVFACPTCQSSSASQKEGDGSCCSSSSSIHVLRCQLPQENPYFPAHPSTENDRTSTSATSTSHDPAWKQHLPETHGVSLCQVCGMRGKYKCPLQQLYFCGKDHQREYKKHVFDKLQHGESPSSALPSVFPIAELIVDAEVLPHDDDDDDDDDAQRDTMFANHNDDDEDSDADLEQEDLNRMTGRKDTVEQDKFTETFMQRIKGQPDQALRYARWNVISAEEEAESHSRGGPSTVVADQVLWIRKDYCPTSIPDCPYCGAPRRFEFQLMPQMLDHFNRHSTADAASFSSSAKYQEYKNALQQADDLIRSAPPESIPPALVENKERATQRMREYLLQQRKSAAMEFGVVAVYTCTKSCGTLEELTREEEEGESGDPTRLAYREEFAWRQPCLDLS